MMVTIFYWALGAFIAGYFAGYMVAGLDVKDRADASRKEGK